MKLVSIDSKKSFKFHGSRADHQEPERPFKQRLARLARMVMSIRGWLILLAGLGLTAWLPTLVWCLVINNPLPSYLIATSELIGSLIGFLLYQAPPPGFISCVPVIQKPVAQNVRRFLKAA